MPSPRDRVHFGPPLPREHAHRHHVQTLAFQDFARHGLDLCGTPAVFGMGLAPTIYLKKCTTLAFVDHIDESSAASGANVVEIDEPTAEAGLPATTLRELRRLQEEGQWSSLFARGLLSGTIAVKQGRA